MVEVMSQHRAYDRILKRNVYADAGVPEYWIVDPAERLIELVAGMETMSVVRDGMLTSLHLDGLTVNVGALFPS